MIDMNRLSIFGTTAQVIGVFALSSRVVPLPSAFGVMLAGSLAWLWIGYHRQDWSLVALNSAFTLSNVIGICRWI